MRSQCHLEITPYLTLLPAATGNTPAHLNEDGRTWAPGKKVCARSLLFTIVLKVLFIVFP